LLAAFSIETPSATQLESINSIPSEQSAQDGSADKSLKSAYELFYFVRRPDRRAHPRIGTGSRA
jgi:hypothetical protein